MNKDLIIGTILFGGGIGLIAYGLGIVKEWRVSRRITKELEWNREAIDKDIEKRMEDIKRLLG